MKANITENTGLAPGTYNAIWSGTAVNIDCCVYATDNGPRGSTDAIVIVTEDGTATVETSQGHVKTPTSFKP